MKKINLFNETIIVPNSELVQALHSNKAFGITLQGKIKYAPYDPVDIFIYQGRATLPNKTALGIQERLGSNYEVDKEDDQTLIKPGNAWQDIISYNIHNCHYDATTGGGVTQFADEAIEDMGWMIIDFDVSYAELLEMLEEKTDITLVGVQSEEPHRFSGMGYFDDIEETRKILFDFCQNIIKEKIANDSDYALELLDEDQQEAVEFFKVI